MQNKQTIRVSDQGSIQNHAVISGNGRYVIFSDYGTFGLIEWDRTTLQSRVRVPRARGARVNYDGRFLAFPEYRALVPGDTNDTTDVYVHDRQDGGLERVSVSSNGTQGNSYSDLPEISGDGRFVAFRSNASNLVSGDTNGAWDIFVRDRATAKTERVSVASNGAQANGYSNAPSFSADGRFVAFTTDASNLVAGDTVSTPDVFVHDRTSGQTTRVRPNGVAIPGASISADGRYLTFTTAAALLARDTNATTDAYVVDRSTGTIELISQSSAGTPANGPK